MTQNSVFISSCTRRQLARRRPVRNGLRLAAPVRLAAGLPPAMVVAAAGVAAFIAGRGGL